MSRILYVSAVTSYFIGWAAWLGTEVKSTRPPRPSKACTDGGSKKDWARGGTAGPSRTGTGAGLPKAGDGRPRPDHFFK